MTSSEVASVSTLVSHIDLAIMNDVVTQCDIEPLDCVDKVEESQSDYESNNESECHQTENEYDDNNSSDAYSDSSVNTTSKSTFVVYWSSLILLLRNCLTCSLPATIKDIKVKGSQLIVKLACPNHHENIWKSQPTVNRYSQGNLTLPAAVLFIANTFEKIAKYFDIANI